MAAGPVSIHFVCGETRRPAGNCFATPVLVGRDATAAIVVNEMRETAVPIGRASHDLVIVYDRQGKKLLFVNSIVKKNTALAGHPRKVEAQWPIGYGVGLRIKRSSVRIRPWPLRWVLGQGSLLPLSQGEAFTLASISYLAILVKYILAKKKKKDHAKLV